MKNSGFEQEPIENKLNKFVLRLNLWKKKRKREFCILTNGKQKEHTCFVMETYETKTQGEHRSCIGTYGKQIQTQVLRWKRLKT